MVSGQYDRFIVHYNFVVHYFTGHIYYMLHIKDFTCLHSVHFYTKVICIDMQILTNKITSIAEVQYIEYGNCNMTCIYIRFCMLIVI